MCACVRVRACVYMLECPSVSVPAMSVCANVRFTGVYSVRMSVCEHSVHTHLCLWVCMCVCVHVSVSCGVPVCMYVRV